ncbi:MAG: DUF2318 domain-containing protein [Candidatus Nealsonbacteria bacterium]|nr:DUF2318 domain-containing protein [Candidatus Nealsonbacteria bacterium]
MNYKKILPILILGLVIVLLFLFQENEEVVNQNNDVYLQESKQEYKGERGETVYLANGLAEIDISDLEKNEVRFFNTDLSGKKVYFFIARDGEGVYRAAANECQVCFSARTGFRQEGDEIVCNNCGNRYPLNRIATEKGGCNPAPIDPDIKAENGIIRIEAEKLEEISYLF